MSKFPNPGSLNHKNSNQVYHGVLYATSIGCYSDHLREFEAQINRSRLYQHVKSKKIIKGLMDRQERDKILKGICAGIIKISMNGKGDEKTLQTLVNTVYRSAYSKAFSAAERMRNVGVESFDIEAFIVEYVHAVVAIMASGFNEAVWNLFVEAKSKNVAEAKYCMAVEHVKNNSDRYSDNDAVRLTPNIRKVITDYVRQVEKPYLDKKEYSKLPFKWPGRYY